MRRLGLALFVAAVAACTTARPEPTTAPPVPVAQNESPTASPTLVLPTSSPLATSHVPLREANVVIQPDIEVVYVHESVGMTASAFATNGGAGAMKIASVTVGFGDGATETVNGSCDAPTSVVPIHHRYAVPGDLQLTVAAATLCETGWDLTLDSGEGIRLLPAAAPSSSSWPRCTTRQLKMTDGGTEAALGNVETLIHLKNVSTSGCTLEGYPSLQLVSASGARLPTDVHWAVDGAYMFASVAVGRVALAPGDIASLEFASADNPFGDAADEPYGVACPPAKWLRVTLPDSRQFGTAKVATAPCGGWVSVSPIYPGSDVIGFP